jgi:hypothetical protein
MGSRYSRTYLKPTRPDRIILKRWIDDRGGKTRIILLGSIVWMKLSQTLSQLLVEYADRPLPLHALLKIERITKHR